VPTTFGVVTALTEAQAWERAGGEVGNRGAEAAQAALEMVEFLNRTSPDRRGSGALRSRPAANKMGKRRKAREVALQFLYQLDRRADDPTPFEDDFWSRHPWTRRARLRGLARARGQGAAGQDRRDHRRDRGALGFERMAVVDRNILRMAVYELLCEPPCGQGRDQRGHRDRQEVRHGRVEPLHQRRARRIHRELRPA